MRILNSALRLVVVLLLVVGGTVLARLGLSRYERVRYARVQAAHAPRSAQTLGAMPDVLVESSGLGVSRAYPGVLWTHNDSGDRPRFYAIDTTAHLLGTWDVRGADARDWEDMALARCPPSATAAAPSPGDCLWLADTGDNGLERDTLTVYVVPEPDPAGSLRTVDPLGRVRFHYPDGAHDVEGVAVDREGDLVFVTKGRTGTVLLFDLSAADVEAALRGDTVVVLPAGRPLPIEPSWPIGRVVTGAAFSPDGATLAVRAYSEIWFFAWPLPSDAEAVTTCFLGGLEPSGEAVDWEDASTLLLTSETSGRGRGDLVRVRCDLAPPT